MKSHYWEIDDEGHQFDNSDILLGVPKFRRTCGWMKNEKIGRIEKVCPTTASVIDFFMLIAR